MTFAPARGTRGQLGGGLVRRREEHDVRPRRLETLLGERLGIRSLGAPEQTGEAARTDGAPVLLSRGEDGDDLGVRVARKERAELRSRVAGGPDDRGARHPRPRRGRPGRRPDASRRASRCATAPVAAARKIVSSPAIVPTTPSQLGLVDRTRHGMRRRGGRLEDDEVPRPATSSTHSRSARSRRSSRRAFISPSRRTTPPRRARRSRPPTSRGRGP